MVVGLDLIHSNRVVSVLARSKDSVNLSFFGVAAERLDLDTVFMDG